MGTAREALIAYRDLLDAEIENERLRRGYEAEAERLRSRRRRLEEESAARRLRLAEMAERCSAGERAA